MAKEPTLAFQWFDRAAAQGHVLAMHNAAVLLAEACMARRITPVLRFGSNGRPNMHQGQPVQRRDPVCTGLGVNQNLQEAYRWFAIAAAQGDQDAAKKRDDIAARLTKDQIAKENDR